MPRPSKRDRYHHGDLRRALLDVTLDLVRTHGVEAFSLRKAAGAVGVDPAAVYRHFASKGDLLAAVASEGFAALARQMEQAIQTEASAVARFRAVGGAYVRFAVARPELFRVMFGPFGAGGPGPARGEGASGRSPYEILVDVLGELAASEPGVGPPQAGTLPAWSAVHGLSTLLVDGPVAAPDEAALTAMIDRLLDVTVAGLRHSGP